MKTQHTPAPWFVYDIDGAKVISDKEKSALFGRLVTMAVILPSPDREFNARLIASAPELLDALEWTFDRLSNLNIPEQGGSCDGFGWDTEGNKLKIENIIKKAKGV